MLVSILIPTLNRRALLERAVASALAQTHREVELVISDDGSSDGTGDYLLELARREPRVRLAPKNPHPGLFPNMNHLLEQRRGAFFCVLADDDLLEPEFVARTLQHLADHSQCVACFCGISRVDGGERFLRFQATELRPGPGLLDDVVRHTLDSQLLLSNVLYRSAALAELRFNLDCLGTAEMDFNLRARLHGPFFYCPDALSIIRDHPDQACRSQTDYMAVGLLRTLELHHFTRADEELLRLRTLQQTRTGYASLLAGTRRAACLALIGQYLGEGPRHWRPRALASLTLSALRTILPPRAQAYVERALRTRG